MLRAGDRARDIGALLELVEQWTRRLIADGEDAPAAKSVLGFTQNAIAAARSLANAKDDAEHAEVVSRYGHYADEELRYAAGARCPCGAGLAYHKRTSIRGAWECSDVLTGRAARQLDGVTLAVEHTEPLPFAFFEVKSEDQPSAQGHSTRPKG
jgi:hypothetical protein